MKHTFCLAALILAFATGCTSVSVKPVAAGKELRAVSIVENPKVKVADFVDVLVAGFARHGINAKVVKTEDEAKNEYMVTYVAYRKWDMAPYLCDATINMTKDGQTVATATYHLMGGGGLSPAKWNGTKSKIDPVIDQLLEHYN
jgi:hypothetical protein